MRQNTIAAVLWDMDGTLIDSEPSWIHAQLRLVDEHRGSWSWDEGLRLVGADMTATADAMRSAGVDLGDAEIIDRLTRDVCDDLERAIHWRPGARELVTVLAASGIPQAIITTSTRTMAQIVAGRLPDGAIGAIVGGDDVTRGKPHPEPYLAGAELCGAAPSACVAIEDSPTGLAAAIAAGTIAIAVPHDTQIPHQPGCTVLPTLDGVSVEDLVAIAQGQRSLTNPPTHPTKVHRNV